MRVWVEAARPRTLVAGAVPVIVGTASSHRFIGWRFAVALLVALALQVAVNFANDLFDASRGVDTPERVGPRRAVSTGLVTPRQMKVAVGLSLGVAATGGLALAVAVGYELLIVGAASFGAALAYSGGPRPYGSAGLGEVFVFVFFGVVATVGSAYVQSREIEAVALTAAVPIGLFASAILVANNLRDIEGDERAGKLTLAVRLGAPRTRSLFRSLLAVALAATFAVAATARSAWPLLGLLAAPATRAPMTLISRRDAPGLVGALTATARLELLYGGLLALGLWLGTRAPWA
ncbi:1,4-dihydroxy-2-naphthoate polyprenyltransferase [soil metagenome]